MRVSPDAAVCRKCGGELEITEAEDARLTLQCLDCGGSYLDETDAFNDSGIRYWPLSVAAKLQEPRND